MQAATRTRASTWLVGPVVLGALGILITVALAVLPRPCPAISPAPAYCSADSRILPAVIGCLLVAVLFLLVLAVGAGGREVESRRYSAVLVVFVAGVFCSALLVLFMPYLGWNAAAT